MLLACLAAGCGKGVPEKRTLRIAYATDFKTMDPALGNDAETLPYLLLLYQGLLDCDDNQQLVPWLAAEMPAVSADRRVYTFRLRQGVRFANGRELEAADFVYSLERTLDPATKSAWPPFLRNIKGARDFEEARKQETGRGARTFEPVHVAGLSAPDRTTLRIELEKPDLAFLWVLTLPFTYAVPREEVERLGDEFYRHPCGTGPCVLAEWQRGLRLRFERNPHYSGTPPGYDALEVLIGYDELTTTMMFERGELDILTSLPRPDFVRFSHDPRWQPQLHSLLLNATDFLVMNCEMEPFTRREVRQAVCYAVDRERIVKVLSNRGIAARSLVPPGVPGHDPSRPGYARDPAKARRLLAEAGYPDGFSVPLWYIADTERWGKIAEVVQQDLKEVGIQVELRPAAYSVCLDAIGRRKAVPFSLSGWTEDYPDPGDFLHALCEGTRIVDDGCNNMAFYDSKEVNKLLASAAVETDPDKRLALYRQAEDIVMDDAPYCVLLNSLESRMCQPWVKGFRLHPMWLVRYDKLSLERP
jgi:peptide/nickel transport system substrate-binding protein